MAAISSALLTFLGAGDHLLVQDVVYGGTANMLEHDLPRWGINHTRRSTRRIPASWEARDDSHSTRLIYVETLTNPLVQMADLEAVVAFARANGLDLDDRQHLREPGALPAGRARLRPRDGELPPST